MGCIEEGKASLKVAFYTIRGGGHTWPMGWPYLGEKIVGRVSNEIDACNVIWAFFATQSLH